MQELHRIVDITATKKYEKYMYKCLASVPARKYRRRSEYLQNAIPKGFHKKIVIYKSKAVGTIEYAPADASGLPISGKNVFVMNCIWVLRKVKGNNLGKMLLKDAIRSMKNNNAHGVATIALENHPSPWLKLPQMTKLGFKAIHSLELKYRIKRKGHLFKIYLMWLPLKKGVEKPVWEAEKLLEGVTFCLAHPLYHAQHITLKNIFETKER